LLGGWLTLYGCVKHALVLGYEFILTLGRSVDLSTVTVLAPGKGGNGSPAPSGVTRNVRLQLGQRSLRWGSQ
jgi:hypothetical protein